MFVELDKLLRILLNDGVPLFSHPVDLHLLLLLPLFIFLLLPLPLLLIVFFSFVLYKCIQPAERERERERDGILALAATSRRHHFDLGRLLRLYSTTNCVHHPELRTRIGRYLVNRWGLIYLVALVRTPSALLSLRLSSSDSGGSSRILR